MRFMKTGLAVASAVLVLASVALAQSTTGTISGRVVDTQGLPVPGVTIVATSPNLQGTRETVTSANARVSSVRKIDPVIGSKTAASWAKRPACVTGSAEATPSAGTCRCWACRSGCLRVGWPTRGSTPACTTPAT